MLVSNVTDFISSSHCGMERFTSAKKPGSSVEAVSTYALFQIKIRLSGGKINAAEVFSPPYSSIRSCHKIITLLKLKEKKMYFDNFTDRLQQV